MNKLLEVKKEIQKINKQIDRRKYLCLHKECQEYSVNSHFLQRNGILSKISEDNHFYEAKVKDIFKISNRKDLLEFKRISVNDGFSLPIFCSEHDNKVFRPIETGVIDFDSYTSQLLISYRTICAELRKKEIEYLRLELISSSNIFNTHLSEEQKSNNDSLLFGYDISCQELNDIKIAIELELTIPESKFQFVTRRFRMKEICISSIFTPDDEEKVNEFNFFNPLKNVIINIFPFENETVVIAGYLKELSNNWIVNYVESFNKMNDLTFELAITRLIIQYSETWAISPKYFVKLNKENINHILSEIVRNLNQPTSEFVNEFNLFDYFN